MDKCFVETLRKWFLPQHRTIDDRMFRSCRLEANWQSTMGVTKMTQAAQFNLGDLLLPSALVREKVVFSQRRETHSNDLSINSNYGRKNLPIRPNYNSSARAGLTSNCRSFSLRWTRLFPRSSRSTGLHLSHVNITPRSRMVNKDLSAVTEILIFKIMNGLRKCYLP